MYALRDVTATVRAVPLQTASIMCKKLAENPDCLVLDVKCGRGAFNQDPAESEALARSMIAAGVNAGKPTTAFVTRMDRPLGRAVGNYNEVLESVALLRGEGRGAACHAADLEALCVTQAAQLLVAAGHAEAPTLAAGVAACRARLADGRALSAFERMVAAQGGDARALHDPAAFPALSRAAHTLEVRAAAAGYVADVDALALGRAAVLLGAGRQRIGDAVDFAAGVDVAVKGGGLDGGHDGFVEKGELLCTLKTNRGDAGCALHGDAVARALAAYDIAPEAPAAAAAAGGGVLDDLIVSHVVPRPQAEGGGGALEFDVAPFKGSAAHAAVLGD